MAAPERVVLPRAAASRWSSGDVILALVLAGILLASSGWAGSGLVEVQALDRRLSRLPTAEDLARGRIWGPAILEVDASGRGVCRIEAWDPGDSDDAATIEWSQDVVLARRATIAGRVVTLDDGVSFELVDVEMDSIARADLATFGRDFPPVDDDLDLEAGCVGSAAYVDGCLADDRLTGCEGESLTMVPGAEGEPIVRLAGSDVPLAVGLATPFAVFLLALLFGKSATAGRTAWALARRAGFSPRISALVDRGPWQLLLTSLGVSALGIILALTDSPRWAQSIGPAASSLWVLGIAGIAAARIANVLAARRFMRRLQTSTLARLSAREENVELSLRVPDDAPTLTLPFLEGRWACVQLRYEDEGVRTWPDRVTLCDATGTAELALDAFEICGWRSKFDVETWTKERPALIDRIEEAVGAPVVAPKATSLSYSVWALAPGDAVYLVGEAQEVGRAFGSYRSGGNTTLASRSAIPAVAVVGEEDSLHHRIEREVRNQSIVLLLSLALAASLVAASVIVIG